MQTLAHACTPRDSIFDPSRRDTVLDLTDLIRDRIDPAAFFGENYVTEGMRILLTEAFRRLEGKSTQGVFELTQEMGGGKTHLLNALGLLARGSLCVSDRSRQRAKQSAARAREESEEDRYRMRGWPPRGLFV
ncbi:MAG: hypothetical protein KFB96_18550 [Thiocapsa sp.]|uniref:hypothetical protein n=1 Tax=Thiocapsa sp. TaxID=2024551 RepID=UPI001BCB3A64|nr:hypothetical protein [Thiocapsa sp.]QVL47672.1 MAG: hypothetical protein KFB96_18550 [Thiocapsa sp.]